MYRKVPEGTGVELYSKKDGMFEKEIDSGTFCPYSDK